MKIFHFKNFFKAGDFPLREMLNFHNTNNSSFTILSTEATENQSVNYGCIVADKTSKFAEFFFV